jgi:hypothetical protein
MITGQPDYAKDRAITLLDDCCDRREVFLDGRRGRRDVFPDESLAGHAHFLSCCVGRDPIIRQHFCASCRQEFE